MRTLRVALEDDDHVIITPSDDVSPEEWRAVILFWSRDLITPNSSRRLDVSMIAFIEKVSWLKEVWKRSGGTYDVEPNVIAEAKKLKDGSQAFRFLKTQNTKRHANREVDVPNLLEGRKLTPRQHENILYLLDMENGANFSVPGAGKTLTALCVWQILKSRDILKKLLVVAPRSAFEAWQNEPFDSFGFKGITEVYSGRIISENTDICIDCR
jgi:hypothetical protein